jgi:pantoate--beta-alanine ligase
MVAKNNLSVNVVGCPIHRESNNLAMSSRNDMLRERAEAALIYKNTSRNKKNLQPTVISAVCEWVQKRFKTILIYFRIFHYC